MAGRPPARKLHPAVGEDVCEASTCVRFSRKADPAILLIGLPNLPAYPSNHAAVSPALAGVLGSRFPADRERLWAHGQEAAISRLYGGIHYRFDLDAGTQLALSVVALASERDVDGHEPFPD